MFGCLAAAAAASWKAYPAKVYEQSKYNGQQWKRGTADEHGPTAWTPNDERESHVVSKREPDHSQTNQPTNQPVHRPPSIGLGNLLPEISSGTPIHPIKLSFRGAGGVCFAAKIIGNQ